MRKCCVCGAEITGTAILTLVSVVDPEIPAGKTSQYHYCRQCAPTLEAFDKEGKGPVKQ